jgi:hypothetical protein
VVGVSRCIQLGLVNLEGSENDVGRCAAGGLNLPGKFPSEDVQDGAVVPPRECVDQADNDADWNNRLLGSHDGDEAYCLRIGHYPFVPDGRVTPERGLRAPILHTSLAMCLCRSA